MERCRQTHKVVNSLKHEIKVRNLLNTYWIWSNLHIILSHTHRDLWTDKEFSLLPACLAVCNLKSIIICDSIHSIPPCASAFHVSQTHSSSSRWKNFFPFLVEIFISHAAIISSTLISLSLNSMRKCVSEEEVFTMTISGVCGFSKFSNASGTNISLKKALFDFSHH